MVFEMKKKIILSGFILLFFAFAVINCNAQSSNNEQRLVGTWTDLHGRGETLVFNTNGTISGWDGRTHWAAAGDTLIIYSGISRSVRRFQISNDGRTLIIDEYAYRRA